VLLERQGKPSPPKESFHGTTFSNGGSLFSLLLLLLFAIIIVVIGPSVTDGPFAAAFAVLSADTTFLSETLDIGIGRRRRRSKRVVRFVVRNAQMLHAVFDLEGIPAKPVDDVLVLLVFFHDGVLRHDRIPGDTPPAFVALFAYVRRRVVVDSYRIRGSDAQSTRGRGRGLEPGFLAARRGRGVLVSVIVAVAAGMGVVVLGCRVDDVIVVVAVDAVFFQYQHLANVLHELEIADIVDDRTKGILFLHGRFFLDFKCLHEFLHWDSMASVVVGGTKDGGMQLGIPQNFGPYVRDRQFRNHRHDIVYVRCGGAMRCVMLQSRVVVLVMDDSCLFDVC
jgi:hypothetical protein